MKVIEAKTIGRDWAFELWKDSPMSMLTLRKRFNVQKLFLLVQKAKVKPNILLCWCIGKAAAKYPEFKLLKKDG